MHFGRRLQTFACATEELARTPGSCVCVKKVQQIRVRKPVLPPNVWNCTRGPKISPRGHHIALNTYATRVQRIFVFGQGRTYPVRVRPACQACLPCWPRKVQSAFKKRALEMFGNMSPALGDVGLPFRSRMPPESRRVLAPAPPPTPPTHPIAGILVVRMSAFLCLRK